MRYSPDTDNNSGHKTRTHQPSHRPTPHGHPGQYNAHSAINKTRAARHSSRMLRSAASYSSLPFTARQTADTSCLSYDEVVFDSSETNSQSLGPSHGEWRSHRGLGPKPVNSLEIFLPSTETVHVYRYIKRTLVTLYPSTQ